MSTRLLLVGDIVGWLGPVFQPSGDTEVFKNMCKLFICHTHYHISVTTVLRVELSQIWSEVLLWWSLSTDVLGRVGTIH